MEKPDPIIIGEGQRYWCRIDKDTGNWTHTIRTMGEWCNPIGVEVARLNSAIIGKYGIELVDEIVRALNALPVRSLEPPLKKK